MYQMWAVQHAALGCIGPFVNRLQAKCSQKGSNALIESLAPLDL